MINRVQSLQPYFKKFSRLFDTTIGVDLGSTRARVWRPGRGVIWDEPNLVAIDRNRNSVAAIGSEAAELVGKAPRHIEIVAPFFGGTIADGERAGQFLQTLLHIIFKDLYLLRPLMMISVAADASVVEREALTKICFKAGARQLYLIESLLAAAIGSGIPTAHSSGNMIVHIGGGSTSVAVVSLGSIVWSDTIRQGGMDMDQAILRRIQRLTGMKISLDMAELVKQKSLNLCRQPKNPELEISGKDLSTGQPRTIKVSVAELLSGLGGEVTELTELIQSFLRRLPAELSSDVIEKGIMMTGGGAQLNGLDYCLSQVVGVPVSVAEDSELCVINGIGVALDNLDLYRRSLAYEGMGE